MSRLHLQAMFWGERPPHTKQEVLLVNLIHGNKSKGQKPVHSVYQLTKGVRSFSIELVASTLTKRIPIYLFLAAARNGEANERLVNSTVNLRGNRIPRDRMVERRRKQTEFPSKERKELEELPWL